MSQEASSNYRSDQSYQSKDADRGLTSDKQLTKQLYQAILSNQYIRSGKRQINRVSKPLVAKCNELKQGGLNQVQCLQEKSLSVYDEGKNTIKDFFYSPTLYSHLMRAWMILNTPYDGKVYSREEFINTLERVAKVSKKKREVKDETLNNFYDTAQRLWTSMSSETKDEEEKRLCLRMMAHTIALEFHLKGIEFEKPATDAFLFISAVKLRVPSFQAFLAVFIAYTGLQEVKTIINLTKAAKAFFDSAKRFCFVDFPAMRADHSMLQFITHFLIGKSDITSDIFLIRLDHSLDRLSSVFKAPRYYEDSVPVTTMERLQSIGYKTRHLTTYVSEIVARTIQNSSIYQKLDVYVDFEQRQKELSALMQVTYDYAELLFIDPTREAVVYAYDKVVNQYYFIMKDICQDFIREQGPKLREKYHFLRNATIHLKDQVLEIRFDKESLRRYKDFWVDELQQFYTEARCMSYDRMKIYSSKLYNRALENIKQKAKDAQNQVKYHKEVDEKLADQQQHDIQEEEQQQQEQEETQVIYTRIEYDRDIIQPEERSGDITYEEPAEQSRQEQETEQSYQEKEVEEVAEHQETEAKELNGEESKENESQEQSLANTQAHTPSHNSIHDEFPSLDESVGSKQDGLSDNEDETTKAKAKKGSQTRKNKNKKRTAGKG